MVTCDTRVPCVLRGWCTLDNEGVLFATCLLDGSAKVWWQSIFKNARGPLPFSTFAEFEIAFLAQFQPFNRELSARQELDKLV